MSKNCKDSKTIDLIEDPTAEDGFEGLFCGRVGYFDPEPLDFDIHAADKYIRENGLEGITEEIKKQFAFQKTKKEPGHESK